MWLDRGTFEHSLAGGEGESSVAPGGNITNRGDNKFEYLKTC